MEPDPFSEIPKHIPTPPEKRFPFKPFIAVCCGVIALAEGSAMLEKFRKKENKQK